MREQGHDLTIYFANSNIHPEGEYERRLETLREWAATQQIPVVEGRYDRAEWDATAGAIGQAAVDACESENILDIDSERRAARCRACYRLRLEECADYAAKNGFTGLGTTLSVSPYQYTDIIREEVERAAKLVGIQPVFEDFRPHYDEATRISRELGMYRQNHCGCHFSDREAEQERADRKAARVAAKAAERAAHAEERAAEDAARAARKAERADYNKKQAKKRAILKALREQSKAHEDI